MYMADVTRKETGPMCQLTYGPQTCDWALYNRLMGRLNQL